jgi:Fe-S-cluster containining protein
MGKRKFVGKVHEDPETALTRGRREVMASLWQEYLSAILEVAKESRRFQVLQAEVEKAAGFPEIFKDWNDLALEARAAAWRRLLAAARERRLATREVCVRCGECCELGSPTLLTPDLALFQQEILTWNEVYTLRPGETVTSREREAAILKEERLKVREVPGSRQCCFYLAASRSCRIHAHRPEQCRRQNCWGEPAPEPEPGEFLSRGHLLKQVPEIWELIQAHAERCALAPVAKALEDPEAAPDLLFEALHFDHYLRRMLTQEWGLSAAAADFLLGRPLPEFLRGLGLTATLTPAGVFRLERSGPAAKN